MSLQKRRYYSQTANRNRFGYLSGRFRQASVVLLVVLVLFSNAVPIARAESSAAEDSAKSAELTSAFFKELEGAIKEHYTKAKITRTDRKLHFEYKARASMSPNNKQEIIPDFGGVIGDLELKPGQYTGKQKLPMQYNEHAFYSVILMAPYSAKHNSHLYTKLEYPSDTGPEFIEKFREIVNRFDESVASVEPIGKTASAKAEDGSNASETPAQTKTSDKADETPPIEAKPPAKIEITGGVENEKSPFAEAEDANLPKAFFWKATKGKDTIYLLGTIHGAISQFYPLPESIDRAFDQSKHLMVEIAIDKVDGSKVSKMRDQLGLYTPPDHLSAHLTPNTKKVFEQYLGWSGESWAMYEKFRPWYAAELAAASKHWRGDNFRASLGLDLYFLARARESGKLISDLETIEQQLHIDADLSDAAQDMLLQTSILGMKDLDADTKGYLSAWKAGDMKKMEDLAMKDSRQHPELVEYEKRMLDDRNVGMVAKAQQLIKVKPGPHFLAVGAAHLVGDMGLVRLFEKEGWDVHQVSAAVPSSAHTDGGFKKQLFQERFRIWFPDQPKRIADEDTVRYEFYEPPVGAYLVCVFTAPTDPSTWPIPAPLMLDKLVSAFKPDPSTRKSMMLQGYPGREVECAGDVFDSKAQAASAKTPVKPGAAKGKPAVGKPVVKPARPKPGRAPSSETASADINFGPYMADLQRRIKRAWFPPKGNETKRVAVRFKVHKDGVVSDLKVHKSSGVPIADQAALKAVEDAAPFRPLPVGSPDQVDILFTFDYNVYKGGAPETRHLTPGAAFSTTQRKKGLLPTDKGFGLGLTFDKVRSADLRARIRAYLVGRRFFLVCAVGTKPFLASENVTRFFDSLELLGN